MNNYLAQLSTAARSAVYEQQWATVDACAREIRKLDVRSPEGHFLAGLVHKASSRAEQAVSAFATALELDTKRYDAAIELAHQHSAARRFSDAAVLVADYEETLGNSPVYLNMAGSVYSEVGMPERAMPLLQKANELQPGVPMFQANLASCSVFLGRIVEARAMYKRLLQRFPTHQRYHYQLAQLKKATDEKHIEQMKKVVRSTNMPDEKNVFMYYAIGKELEDLEAWDEAFEYFNKAGDAVTSVAEYDINTDLQLIDTCINVCSADWLRNRPGEVETSYSDKTPIFVVGLPRTGTTLTERIIASHSQVESVGETQFMQMVLRRESGIISEQKITPEMIEAAARLDIGLVGDGYMDMVRYKFGDEPMFVDKLPFNIFYLGFIAKAFPSARIVHVKRNPMDSCFAMYKQVFTWAYKFSYTLDGLGRFYPAYLRLVNHWRETIGDRMIEIEYEELVDDQEERIGKLLERLGLGFEEACLNFDQNTTATATASAIQVREKIHSRSVNRWRQYEKQLQPLKDCLEHADVAVE